MIRHPKYNKGNIYLSGGIQYAQGEGAGWREHVSGNLKWLGYFPLNITELDAAYAAEHGKIYNDFPDTEDGALLRKANIRKQFIYADLELIKNDTDALIVYYDESVRRGAGTISECQFAYLLDIPVYMVTQWENWQDEVPGWLYGLTTKTFATWNELFYYLGELPPGILKRDRYGNHHVNNEYLCSLTGETFTKGNQHFVSRVSPLYSKKAVNLVTRVNELQKDRYEFFMEILTAQTEKEGTDA